MHRAEERMRREGPDGPSRAEHMRGRSPWLTSAKFKLVDGCNLRCFMCDYWKQRRKGELTTVEVKRALGELAELGCQKVHFTGGELFLRRDAIELLTHAAELGLRTNLTTNGTLLDRQKIRDLLSIPVRSVTLSIDSPVRRVHDTVRGREGCYAQTTKTLDRLLARRKKKTRVALNTVVSAQNFRTLVEMPEFLRDRPIDRWLLIPMDPWNQNPHALQAEQLVEYNTHIAPTLADTIGIPGFDPWIYGKSAEDLGYASRGQWARGFYQKHRCHVPWFHTLIDSRGNVYPCCMGHGRLPDLGNIREQTLAEIFNGPAYVTFRQRMLDERPTICSRCDDFLPENQAFARLEHEWSPPSS